jgi:hypothetical protein
MNCSVHAIAGGLHAVRAGLKLAMRFLRDAYLAIKRDTLVLAFDVFFAD